MKFVTCLFINIFATINSQVIDTIEDKLSNYNLYAQISNYPGYDGSLNVSGTVNMTTKEDSILFTYHFLGVPPNAKGGWHVHTGQTCSKHALVGGHLFTFSNNSFDPWIPVLYESDEFGEAKGELDMPHFTEDELILRTVVVHAPDGTRVGCGEVLEVGLQKIAKDLYADKVKPHLLWIIPTVIVVVCCCIFWCCFGISGKKTVTKTQVSPEDEKE